MQKKSTGDSSGLPFACGFLSCSLWLRYGIITGETVVIIANIIGASLFLIYSLIYLVFTVHKKAYLQQFAAVVIFLIAIIVYTTDVVPSEHDAIRIMGILCCIVTVFFFAAPLTMLLHVIRIKNSESLPFPLIAMSFLVSVQWLAYGVIIDDMFIQIPNFFGCLLSLLQLCLFVCYPPKSFSGQGYTLINQPVIY